MQKINKILNDYKNKYDFRKVENLDTFKTFFQYGIILIPYYKNMWKDDRNLFALLHEIGHCETYKKRQSRAVMEFKATQWAINNCEKYNIVLDQQEKDEWQDYIYSFTKTKNKEIYKLDWE